MIIEKVITTIIKFLYQWNLCITVTEGTGPKVSAKHRVGISEVAVITDYTVSSRTQSLACC